MPGRPRLHEGHLGPDRKWITLGYTRGVAQLGSAPALGAGGPRFKSGRPDSPQDDRKGRLMCRWLAYSGSPLLLKEALYGGPNSLVDQSLHSRLGAEPTNGDGFGVGWYGAPDTPGVYHSTEPAWNDRNLRELAEHISSPLFFTHIRAAIGSAVQQTNCHPFRHENWLFMQNGY